MNMWLRFVGFALFCAIFGMAGALGGVWLAADELRGARGVSGPMGPAGPPGARGEVGPAGEPFDIGSVPTWDMEQAVDDTSTGRLVRELQDRVSDLEGAVQNLEIAERVPCPFRDEVLTASALDHYVEYGSIYAGDTVTVCRAVP